MLSLCLDVSGWGDVCWIPPRINYTNTHTLPRLPGRWWDYYPSASSKFLSATARWKERQRNLGTCLWTRKTVGVKRFLQISFVALFCFIIAKSSYANDLFVARRDQFFSSLNTSENVWPYLFGRLFTKSTSISRRLHPFTPPPPTSPPLRRDHGGIYP